MNKLIGGALAALLLQGCASVTPPDYDKLGAELDPLLSQPARDQLPQVLALSEQERLERVDDLLFKTLSPGTAQQLALVNSPYVRAHLHRLGIAEAEQLQAHLLRNPRLAAAALRPEGGGRWKLELGLSQSLLDLMTRSLRTSLAEEALIQARLDLLDTLNQELYQVQKDYFLALGAKHREAIAELALEAAEAATLLAERLREAGNLQETTLLHYRSYQLQRQRELRQARADTQQAQAALALRLGLEHPAMMELPATLPQLPENDLASPDDLVAHALAQRLDLRIARQSRAVAEHRQALYQRPGVFTQLDLGIDVERDRAGDGLIGPSLALGLPLFDRNQARRASADAQVQHTHARYQAKQLEIEVGIPELVNRLRMIRDNIQQLEHEVIPLWQQQVALNLREYNFMLAGAFELLNAKAQEFDAWREHGETLERYWVERTHLAMASARPLAVALPDEVSLPELNSDNHNTNHDHHHDHHGGSHHD